LGVRIAHAADIHLGARPYRIVERERDIYVAFNELVDRVIEERAKLLVLAGDIFDQSVPRNSARKVFRDALRKLKERGVRVVGILGDHDLPKMYDVPSTADLSPEEFLLLEAAPSERSSIRALSAPYYHDGNEDLLITGLCARRYGKRENIGDALRTAERLLRGHKIRVLVMHQAIHEKWPFDITGIPMGMIPRDVQYVAMGHIHNRFEMSWGGGRLAYPGSIEALRKDEWNGGKKGFYIVDLDRDSVETQFIVLESVRPQREFRLGTDSPRELREFLESSEKRPIIHILVPADMPRERYFRLMEELYRAVPLGLEAGRVLTVRRHFERPREGGGAGPEAPPERVGLEDVIKEVAGDRAELIIDLLSIVKNVERDRLEKELERRILEWVESEDRKGETG